MSCSIASIESSASSCRQSAAGTCATTAKPCQCSTSAALSSKIQARCILLNDQHFSALVYYIPDNDDNSTCGGDDHGARNHGHGAGDNGYDARTRTACTGARDRDCNAEEHDPNTGHSKQDHSHGIRPPALSPIAASSTHAPVPVWSGSGNLLVGYCATPTYVLINGATVYYIPVIGCVDGKSDCCPYQVPSAATTTAGPSLNNALVPQPGDGRVFSLAKCPDDYASAQGGCCPSGYKLWNSAIGAATPCYSTLANALTPPPVVVTADNGAAGGGATRPTSAIVNVVYAEHYPLQSTKPLLSKNVKIGIGAGAAGAGLLIAALLFLLFHKSRKHARERKSMVGTGTDIGSNRYSVPSQLANDSDVDKWRKSMPPPVVMATQVPIPPAYNQAQGQRMPPQNGQLQHLHAGSPPQGHPAYAAEMAAAPTPVYHPAQQPVYEPPQQRQELAGGGRWSLRHELQGNQRPHG
ncbi:hypothetical protein EJ06DRAFT_519794 [Trichodelitschia bisporula]|uniref:Uncharacterized protein n=1 Tax=Trichodelitschia bisporula TaxID=703511 RepID=A0A6G1I3L8_9PEZI|nr:hypothetical protein EJ06DRAFT_519794 [Trichodelitschia bisporula]